MSAFPSPQATTRMFPDTVTIQRRSVSQDSEGGEVETWGDLFTVRAQFSASPGVQEAEQRTSNGTFVIAPARAYLLGDQPDITEQDRLVRDSHVFDIRAIERDSFEVVTGLLLEEREEGEGS